MPRITNVMLVNDYMNNMQRNLNNMSTYQNQLSTGKNIQRGSENPYIAMKSMQLNAEIDANKQYNTNISDTTNWLDTTDTALGQANNVIKRIKELVIKAGNGSYKNDELTAIDDEVTEKVKELGQVFNTSFDGDFIFGGTKSTSKPVITDANGKLSYGDKNGASLSYTTGFASVHFASGVDINNYKDAQSRISDLQSMPSSPAITAELNHLQQFSQINSQLQTEISDGVVVNYNVTATQMMEFKDSKNNNINVMNQLSDILKCLNVGAGKSTSETLSSENASASITDLESAVKSLNGSILTNLDSISQNLLTLRSNVGALENRMKSAQTNNEDQTYNMTNILSQNEDIDFTEKTMEYSVVQTVYTATLQTSSRVLNTTLLDYLR